MNKAVFDIGTNSIKLLIYSSPDKTIIAEYMKISQLGENLSKTGLISENAIERNIDTLSELIKISNSYDVKQKIAVGTMCLRTAKNKDKFISLVQQKLGLKIYVLSGKQEAELTSKAVLANLKISSNKNIIFDIGGGSTEIILPHLNFSHSFDIGAHQATDQFLHSNPFSDDEANNLKNYFTSLLSQKLNNTIVEGIIGVGGTVTTLVSIEKKINYYNPKHFQNTILTADSLRKQIKLFGTMNHNERKKIVGLHPERARIIPGGAIIILSILEYFSHENLRISSWGLRHGIMLNNFSLKFDTWG